MLLYATKADVVTWLGEEPDADIDLHIRHASLLVARACRNDLYNVDAAGKPEDDDLVDAMRDAVCAQVEYWLAAGINPAAGAGGIGKVATEKTVDGVTIKYDTTSVIAASEQAADSIRCLVDAAYTILRNAGLATGIV